MHELNCRAGSGGQVDIVCATGLGNRQGQVRANPRAAWKYRMANGGGQPRRSFRRLLGHDGRLKCCFNTRGIIHAVS